MYPLFSQKIPKVVQCRLKKVAKTLSQRTPENCHVFPSSRQPQFLRLRSPVTSVHILSSSLVPRQPVSLSPNLASLFFVVLLSLSSIVFLLSSLLLLSEPPILSEPFPLLSELSFLLLLVFLFVPPLLFLSAFSFLLPPFFLFFPPLASQPPTARTIYVVHIPWSALPFFFPLPMTISIPTPFLSSPPLSSKDSENLLAFSVYPVSHPLIFFKTKVYQVLWGLVLCRPKFYAIPRPTCPKPFPT